MPATDDGETRATKAEVIESATALAAKLDLKCGEFQGYPSTWIVTWLNDLARKGRVEVGWRESCGKTDTTMKIYREWVKVLKLLRKGGVVIAEEPVKHKNAWATKAGGFWRSVIYSIADHSPVSGEKEAAA